MHQFICTFSVGVWPLHISEPDTPGIIRDSGVKLEYVHNADMSLTWRASLTPGLPLTHEPVPLSLFVLSCPVFCCCILLRADSFRCVFYSLLGNFRFFLLFPSLVAAAGAVFQSSYPKSSSDFRQRVAAFFLYCRLTVMLKGQHLSPARRYSPSPRSAISQRGAAPIEILSLIRFWSMEYSRQHMSRLSNTE